MYLNDSEKKKVNSGTIGVYEKVLLREEEEEEKLVSSFDRDIETILGKDFVAYLAKHNYIKVREENGKLIGVNVLRDFHYTDIPSDVVVNVGGKKVSVREIYKRRASKFFRARTEELKKELNGDLDDKKMERNLPKCFALASLGLTTFHKRKGMVLRDVQKIAGMGMCYGDIAELGTGEGKTIAAVLPAYTHALRGKGVHVVTANNYLSRRDFEELRPVYEGLGLTCGYVRSQEEKIDDDTDELKVSKRKAYRADITYGAKDEIAFDYLRDSTAYTLSDVVTRDGQPGFAIVDEVDDALVDSATSPYVIAGTPTYYIDDMNLEQLATVLSIPLPKVVEQLKLRGMDTDLKRSYSYEEASRVAELFSKELYRDHHRELGISQLFYEMIRNAKIEIDPEDKKVFDKYNQILEMENGILRVKDIRLFDLLARSMTSDDSAYYYGKYKFTIEEIETLRKYTKVIVCPTNKRFYITNETLEEHINLQFLNSPRVKRYVEKYQHKLMFVLNPPEDYSMSKDNKIRLTMKGFKRLCEDESLRRTFPQFQSIYADLINNRNNQGSFYSHLLNQTIIANELQVKGEDYIVRDGKVILLRNAREREGSNYSNGLHQAIEAKEALRGGAIQTNENPSLASITQKDFYSRYELFSGMTGTSAHKIFSERYGKQTLEVPRDSFYAYYSSKLKKQRRNTTREPRGVEKKKPVFARNRNDKFELIYKSIMDSRKTDPPQPVLIVVSDPKEIELLDAFLRNKGIRSNVIETTRLTGDKRKSEAMMVAMAGLSGTVTIATEMAGRGTDIKIGGDREMLIDIAADRMMKEKNLPETLRDSVRLVCEEQLVKLGRIPTKEEEERDREKLADVGLKVISSGFFNSKRIDKQLEGRTGRNGYSGTTERYSSIEDLTHLGIERVEEEPLHNLFERATRNPDGSIVFRSKDYTRLLRGIEIVQNAYDDEVSENLKFSEDITRYTTEVMDRLRSKRRHLLELTQDKDKLLENSKYIIEETEKMIKDTVDNLIISYITKKDVREYDSRDGKEKLDINYEGLALAIKETLGIELNVESIRRSDISVYELREALLNLAISIHRDGLSKDEEKQLEQDVNALLTSSNNSLSRIHEREDAVRRQKALDMITKSESADSIAILSISEMLHSLEFESARAGTRLLMGVVLSKEEKDKLDKEKKKTFDYRLVDDETYEPLSIEDDYESITEMRKDRASKERGYVSEREHADKKAEKALRKDKDANVSHLYTNLDLRPVAFVLAADGTFVLKKGMPQRQNLSDSKKTI